MTSGASSRIRSECMSSQPPYGSYPPQSQPPEGTLSRLRTAGQRLSATSAIRRDRISASAGSASDAPHVRRATNLRAARALSLHGRRASQSQGRARLSPAGSGNRWNRLRPLFSCLAIHSRMSKALSASLWGFWVGNRRSRHGMAVTGIILSIIGRGACRDLFSDSVGHI